MFDIVLFFYIVGLLFIGTPLHFLGLSAAILSVLECRSSKEGLLRSRRIPGVRSFYFKYKGRSYGFTRDILLPVSDSKFGDNMRRQLVRCARHSAQRSVARRGTMHTEVSIGTRSLPKEPHRGAPCAGSCKLISCRSLHAGAPTLLIT